MPAEDFTGEDGFSYTVSDGYSTATGWVTMNVVADDTLQAVDDAYTTQENQDLNAGSGSNAAQHFDQRPRGATADDYFH